MIALKGRAYLDGYPDIPSVSGLTLRNGTLEEKSPADFVFEADKCVHCNRA